MRYIGKYAIIVVGLWTLALPARAQKQVGGDISMNLNGNVAFGYNGAFSDATASTHGLNGGGNADLSGYYYNPAFLSFDVQPFYNQSRANSNFQSLFQSSGVGASASIFSGSKFPGTVSYSRSYGSEGGLVVPGVGNITTHGNSDDLAIGWGIRLPDYPLVSIQFMDGHNSNSVFGTDEHNTANIKTLGITATDTLAGFNLSAGYHRDQLHALTAAFLTGGSPSATDSSGNSFNVGVGHTLPLSGSFSVGYSRSDLSSNFTGGNYNATIDTINSNANFQPARNLNVGVNAQYTNNLGGMLYQSVITAGGLVPAELLSYSTHALDINSQATYTLPTAHMSLIANADHRKQTALGLSVSSDTFGQLATYGNDLLGGFINLTGGLTETRVDSATTNNSLGLIGNVSYNRRVQKWNLNGSFNYSRNTQTVLISYTSSGYGYAAGIGRKLGPYSYWNFNAGGAKTTFENLPGSGSHNQSYSTAFTLRRFSVSGAYGTASGTSILTPTGLTPSPNPIPLPGQIVLFGGHSYSVGGSTTPVRGLTLSAIYSNTKSNTTGNSTTSRNSTEQFNTMLQYKLRRVWITGGYLKLNQGFSFTGQPPASYSSFFIGISRWFNFF